MLGLRSERSFFAFAMLNHSNWNFAYYFISVYFTGPRPGAGSNGVSTSLVPDKGANVAIASIYIFVVRERIFEGEEIGGINTVPVMARVRARWYDRQKTCTILSSTHPPLRKVRISNACLQLSHSRKVHVALAQTNYKEDSSHVRL